MDPDPLPPQVIAGLDRLDELIGSFEEETDADLQARVFELLSAIDVVHRAGLQRLDELLKVAGLQARAIDDPEVKLLYDLYDLGEGGEVQRAKAVLSTVEPYVESHGGRLEVVSAGAGVVTVRLSGACAGCQGSTATLRHLVEGTLRESMADFVRLEVEEAPGGGHGHDHDHSSPQAAPGNLISVEQLRPRRPALVWRPVFAAAELRAGDLRSVEVDGEQVLIANVDGEFYAYHDGCPGSPLTLASAAVEDHTLVCPWHGCRFDLLGGRRLDGEGPALSVMPIAVENGEVRIGSLTGVAA